MFQLPDIYQATAVLTPAVDEKRPNPALGVLASFGVDIGSPSKVEDLETLFQSNDLTARVFRKYNLWPIVLPDRFDPATGKMKFGWTRPVVPWRERTESPRRLGCHPRCEGSPACFHQQEGGHGFRVLRISVRGRFRQHREILSRRREKPPPGGGTRPRGQEQEIHRGADREDGRCLDTGPPLLAVRPGSRTRDDGPEPGAVRFQGGRRATGAGQEIKVHID